MNKPVIKRDEKKETEESVDNLMTLEDSYDRADNAGN